MFLVNFFTHWVRIQKVQINKDVDPDQHYYVPVCRSETQNPASPTMMHGRCRVIITNSLMSRQPPPSPQEKKSIWNNDVTWGSRPGSFWWSWPRPRGSIRNCNHISTVNPRLRCDYLKNIQIFYCPLTRFSFCRAECSWRCTPQTGWYPRSRQRSPSPACRYKWGVTNR